MQTHRVIRNLNKIRVTPNLKTDAERCVAMAQTMMTCKVLRFQNRAFSGTGGISQENRDFGFIPAFMDQETQLVYVSCGADGMPTPIHVLDGLPEELVLARTSSGHVSAIKGTVIAGFIRNGCFYTREQAAHAIEDTNRDSPKLRKMIS